VLVVDDEHRYRDELELALSRKGYDIRSAATGREAIDLGARYRPNVLVADWMLQGGIHGLHVAEVLRAIDPDVQTILITGYATRDLREHAERAEVCEFIEKPFRLAQICDAVDQAANAPKPRVEHLPIGLVEVDEDGRIVYANAAARELFAHAVGEPAPQQLKDLLTDDGARELDKAESRWVTLRPRGGEARDWQARSRRWEQPRGRLYVLIPHEAQHHRHHPVVRMLLGLAETATVAWPLEGRAMIIDPTPLVRRAVAYSLEAVGCLCHMAETLETAVPLLDRDPGVEVILLDHDLPNTAIAEAVSRLRAIRPNVRIVGTGATEHRGKFAASGVTLFLEKPYVINDLINALTGRIGACVDCGLPIPLRRPRPGETPSHWVCCGCGARYSAVLDESFPRDIQRHVQAAE